MEDRKEFFLDIPALKVEQPLGDFYVAAFNARDLLAVSFAEPLEYTDEYGNVKGSQRVQDKKRLKEIANYIDSVEMAFPNTIILAANYTPQGNISKDIRERWIVYFDNHSGIYRIKIPLAVKLAAIIDGQHRLNAFDYVTNLDRFDNLQLLCSVYFDLPNSYQAFLFATINSNQKKVDRSLALEQFGYNVGEEEEESWTPEKFAVFISRKLNTDKERSPFYQHVKLAPLDLRNIFSQVSQNWVVSTATIVDGILSLISNNVKRDRVAMQQKSVFYGRKRSMIAQFSDKSPLRNWFLSLRDQDIYDVLISFFSSLKRHVWQKSSSKSYIIKTVGVQASFDILKMIIKNNISVESNNINFDSYIIPISTINFSDKFFQASGIGRSRIKNVWALKVGLVESNRIKRNDLPFYENLISGSETGSLKESTMWEEDAEYAVTSILETAQWNYGNRTVRLYIDNDYDNGIVIDSHENLIRKLVEVADQYFLEGLPSDTEFAEMQLENFDAEDMVRSYLRYYEENLKSLKWID